MVEVGVGHLGPWTEMRSNFDAGCYYLSVLLLSVLGVSVAIARMMRIYVELGGGNVNFVVYCYCCYYYYDDDGGGDDDDGALVVASLWIHRHR